jgi:ferredoxin
MEIMSVSAKKSYRNLINHLQTWIFGMPESDHLLPLLELCFTPNEAEFLSKIPFLPHSVEQLSERLNIPTGELKSDLDELARKGAVYRVEGRSAIRYALGDTLLMFYRTPGWPGVDDEWNRKISPLLNQYYIEALAADVVGHHTQGLRTIPVNKTIKDARQIIPYEDIMQVIDQVEYYSVTTCACRHRKKLDPGFGENHCNHETVNCLHFDKLGRYIVQNGLGKEITREKTLEILAKAADEGLVHGVSNTVEGIDTICNCCSTCCLYLESIVKMPEPVPRGQQQSSYIREMDAEKCKACGRCVERCPMKALEITGKEVTFMPDRCLGCGVCVHKCPTGASYLVYRGEDQDVPNKPRDLAYRLLKERGLDPVEVLRQNS